MEPTQITTGLCYQSWAKVQEEVQKKASQSLLMFVMLNDSSELDTPETRILKTKCRKLCKLFVDKHKNQTVTVDGEDIPLAEFLKKMEEAEKDPWKALTKFAFNWAEQHAEELKATMHGEFDALMADIKGSELSLSAPRPSRPSNSIAEVVAKAREAREAKEAKIKKEAKAKVEQKKKMTAMMDDLEVKARVRVKQEQQQQQPPQPQPQPQQAEKEKFHRVRLQEEEEEVKREQQVDNGANRKAWGFGAGNRTLKLGDGEQYDYSTTGDPYNSGFSRSGSTAWKTGGNLKTDPYDRMDPFYLEPVKEPPVEIMKHKRTSVKPVEESSSSLSPRVREPPKEPPVMPKHNFMRRKSSLDSTIGNLGSGVLSSGDLEKSDRFGHGKSILKGIDNDYLDHGIEEAVKPLHSKPWKMANQYEQGWKRLDGCIHEPENTAGKPRRQTEYLKRNIVDVGASLNFSNTSSGKVPSVVENHSTPPQLLNDEKAESHFSVDIDDENEEEEGPPVGFNKNRRRHTLHEIELGNQHDLTGWSNAEESNPFPVTQSRRGSFDSAKTMHADNLTPFKQLHSRPRNFSSLKPIEVPSRYAQSAKLAAQKASDPLESQIGKLIEKLIPEVVSRLAVSRPSVGTKFVSPMGVQQISSRHVITFMHEALFGDVTADSRKLLCLEGVAEDPTKFLAALKENIDSIGLSQDPALAQAICEGDERSLQKVLEVVHQELQKVISKCMRLAMLQIENETSLHLSNHSPQVAPIVLESEPVNPIPVDTKVAMIQMGFGCTKTQRKTLNRMSSHNVQKSTSTHADAHSNHPVGEANESHAPALKGSRLLSGRPRRSMH